MLYSDRPSGYNTSCSVSAESAEQYNITVGEFDSTKAEFINTSLATGGDSRPYGKVVLDVPEKIITFILDESGSMTWSDRSNIRQTMLSRVAHRFDNTYPDAANKLSYNLISFGGSPYNVALFATSKNLGNGNPVDIANTYFYWITAVDFNQRNSCWYSFGKEAGIVSYRPQ